MSSISIIPSKCNSSIIHSRDCETEVHCDGYYFIIIFREQGVSVQMILNPFRCPRFILHIYGVTYRVEVNMCYGLSCFLSTINSAELTVMCFTLPFRFNAQQQHTSFQKSSVVWKHVAAEEKPRYTDGFVMNQ